MDAHTLRTIQNAVITIVPTFTQKSTAIAEKYRLLENDYLTKLKGFGIGAVFIAIITPITSYFGSYINATTYVSSIQYGVYVSICVLLAYVYIRGKIVSGIHYALLAENTEVFCSLAASMLVTAAMGGGVGTGTGTAAPPMPVPEPVFGNPNDTLRNAIWEDTNEAIQGEPVSTMPVLAADAHDPISGQALEGQAYVIDTSLYSAINERTLRELYHPDTWRGRGKNPFTNLVVQQIRKVRVEICDTNAEFDVAKTAYEQSMNGTAVPVVETSSEPRANSLFSQLYNGNPQTHPDSVTDVPGPDDILAMLNAAARSRIVTTSPAPAPALAPAHHTPDDITAMLNAAMLRLPNNMDVLASAAAESSMDNSVD